MVWCIQNFKFIVKRGSLSTPLHLRRNSSVWPCKSCPNTSPVNSIPLPWYNTEPANLCDSLPNSSLIFALKEGRFFSKTKHFQISFAENSKISTFVRFKSQILISSSFRKPFDVVGASGCWPHRGGAWLPRQANPGATTVLELSSFL